MGLRLASEAFDPSTEDAGRLSVIMTLVALDDFLKAMFGVNDPLLFIPIRQLQYALYDLGRGKVVPLLSPKKIKNRPPDSAAKEGFRAFAAVAMDLFVDGGVERKQAARDVARALSRMGYTNGPGKMISAQRVEDWRDLMKTASPEESEAAARFRRMKAQLQAKFPNDLKAAARFVLGRLPAVVPPQIPKKPPLSRKI